MLISTSQAADFLDISRRRVLALIHDDCPRCAGNGCGICRNTGRRLPAKKISGAWVIYQDDLYLSHVTDRAIGRPVELKLPHPFRVTEGGLRIPGEKANERSPDPEQVKISRDWIDTFANRRSTFNANATSYTLKHAVERWADTYISNGAFIQAALLEGYQVKPAPFRHKAYFNMSLPRLNSARHEEAGLR